MNIYLSHWTAVEFWRNCTSVKDCEPSSVRGLASAYAGAHADDRFALSRFGVRGEPFHVLVGTDADRRHAKGCVSHQLSRKLPSGSFCKLAAHVYVTSPELTLAQLSSKLELVELIELMSEFSGLYRRQPTGGCAYDVLPLTSLKKLDVYAKHYGLTGRNSAFRRALRLAFDESGSPMETALVMMLTLPRSMGGYALPKPRLNEKIILPRTLAYQVGSDHFKCDLYWKDRKVVVEYDSDKFHSERRKIANDAMRRNVLESLGIRMLTATWGQVRSATGVDMLAHEIAALLGHRMRDFALGWQYERSRLRETLLSFASQ